MNRVSSAFWRWLGRRIRAQEERDAVQEAERAWEAWTRRRDEMGIREEEERWAESERWRERALGRWEREMRGREGGECG